MTKNADCLIIILLSLIAVIHINTLTMDFAHKMYWSDGSDRNQSDSSTI